MDASLGLPAGSTVVIWMALSPAEMADLPLEQAVLVGVDRRGRAVVVVLEPDRAAGLRLALDRDVVLVGRRAVRRRDDRELRLRGVEDPGGDGRQLALPARPDDRRLERVAALLERDAGDQLDRGLPDRLLDQQGGLGVAHRDVQAERVLRVADDVLRDVDGHVDGIVIGVRLGRGDDARGVAAGRRRGGRGAADGRADGRHEPAEAVDDAADERPERAADHPQDRRCRGRRPRPRDPPRPAAAARAVGRSDDAGPIGPGTGRSPKSPAARGGRTRQGGGGPAVAGPLAGNPSGRIVARPATSAPAWGSAG